MKAKTQILATLGSNLTIKDKKLCTDGQKPFYLIEKGMEAVKEELKKFEPIKELDIVIDSPILVDARTYWLSMSL